MAQHTLTGAAVPYDKLMASADKALEDGDYKLAIILAQTALELFTEAVLATLYRRRHIEYLKPEFERLLINYNLANAKVSSLYMALSGDPIMHQSFWSGVQSHIELRNDIVHEGREASQVDAQRSLHAIHQLMDHIIRTQEI